MKLKYEHNGQSGILYSDEEIQNTNGFLNDHFAKCDEIDKKIRMFVHSHKHHVLRDYYDECKVSGLAFPHDPMNRLLGKAFPVGPNIRYVFAQFFSDTLNVHEYLLIIAKELNIEIINAATGGPIVSLLSEFQKRLNQSMKKPDFVRDIAKIVNREPGEEIL